MPLSLGHEQFTAMFGSHAFLPIATALLANATVTVTCPHARRRSEIETAGPSRKTLMISAMMQTAISAGVLAPMAMPNATALHPW